MNTLEEAINKLFEIYRESCISSKELYEDLDDEEIDLLFSEDSDESHDELDDLENYEDDSDSLDSALNIQREEYYAYLMGNIMDYFDKLKSDDYQTYSDLVSLLSLEYFNLVLIDIENCEEYYPEEDNEVLTYMKYASKDRFLQTVDDSESSYLEEIILTIIQKYKPGYCEHVDYDYLYLERFFDDTKFQKMYKKFHPSIKAELEEIKKYYAHTLMLKNIRKIDFKNLFDYLYLSQFAHANCEKRTYYQEILAYKLHDLMDDNEDLYDQIILYMTQYLYIYLKDKNDRDELEDEALAAIEESEKHDTRYFVAPDYLIDVFYNYDILEHDSIIANLSESEKNKTKKFIKHYDD